MTAFTTIQSLVSIGLGTAIGCIVGAVVAMWLDQGRK